MLAELQKEILPGANVFVGDPTDPFLAPRGVWIGKGKMLVSDTGQNRVYVWNSIPTGKQGKPDLVLGQDLFGSTGRNNQGTASGSSLQYPSAIWSDGERIILGDAWNHRVLIWNSWPTKNGQEADVVIGQKNLKDTQPNIKGVGAEPDAHTLYWPYGVFSNGKELWIADTGNRRVLYFESIPTKNGQSADAVIGKENFTERDYDHENPIWPYSVKISESGQLAITDTQYYRVLVWKHWKDALIQKADLIIGQKDFNQNGQNQFRLTPASNTLNWCYDSCFEGENLWVVDTGNSRLLKHNLSSEKNAPAAIDLIGHTGFDIGSENVNTIMGTENALYWPFSVCIDGNTIAIADTGNHRIIIGDLANRKR